MSNNNLNLSFKYRATVSMTTFEMDEQRTKPFFESVEFEDPNPWVARSKAFSWYLLRGREIDKMGSYVLPFASASEFVEGENACYSMSLSFVICSNSTEDEYVLLGYDDQTMEDTLEVEKYMLGNFDPPPAEASIPLNPTPDPIITDQDGIFFLEGKTVNQNNVNDDAGAEPVSNISSSPLVNFIIHPEVMKTYFEKDLECLLFTMERYGQRTPVKVIERSGQMLIIDGVSRFRVANSLQLPSLIYEIIDVQDHKVMEYRMLSNVKTKRTFTEMCIEVEYVLKMIGTSQGRKRDLLGFDNMENDSDYGQIGKDRYQLACSLLGIEMKASTLRKAMKVFWEDYDINDKSKAGILKLLDEGRISIDKAFNLSGEVKRKEKELEQIEARNYEGKDNEVSFNLYSKSSINMDEVQDESVTLGIQSPPYYKIKLYRNQGNNPHGQEKTPHEYIERQVEFCREVRKKLKPNGVFVLIIGETYRDGYQGICSKLELALEHDGWQIIDVNIWVKQNPKPTGHPSRFLNGYERAIVLCKKGAKPLFRGFTKPSSRKKIEVVAGTQLANGECGYSVGSTQSSITNVITTPVFNKSEWKDIDSEFQHDAPCPISIYKIFIDSYSEPGDLVLDGFCGSSSGLDYALSKGRSVIGYDVDPVSIEFSRKRLEKRLSDRTISPVSAAA